VCVSSLSKLTASQPPAAERRHLVSAVTNIRIGCAPFPEIFVFFCGKVHFRSADVELLV